jgi:2-polyprenyl-6-hydroxyphenyl methylase/3-demethylubiquinone-9 3-methyltransferase
MPVDNTLYDRLAATWWEEEGTLHRMRTVFNPPRFGYFRRVLTEVLHLDPSGRDALDVGCGGGLLAEDFARLGFRVMGVDPSTASIAAAKEHALRSKLAIAYKVGRGEELPFKDASFDLVYCCDVLEHVPEPGRLVAEAARVLRPGGIYAFDTINRTLRSRLLAIKLTQEWSWTNFLPAGLHAYESFIKPAEIRTMLADNGLELRDMTGISARGNPVRLLRLLRRYKKGLVSLDEVGVAARFGPGRNMSIMYIGYAIKSQ